MKLSWLKDPDNIVYADVDKFADDFGKEVGIENLREKIEKFKAKPDWEGITIRGIKRTSLKLFIPDLMFDEHINMGENVEM
ncbi:MAG: hypothetical protein RR769_02215, partial [Anaerovoracaceae bacterium]